MSDCWASSESWKICQCLHPPRKVIPPPLKPSLALQFRPGLQLLLSSCCPFVQFDLVHILGQVARAILKSWAQWLCHVQKIVSHSISPVTGSFVLSASSVIFSQSWSGEGQKHCPIYFWTVNLLLSPLWPDRHPCIHCCPWQKVASLAKVESNPGWDLILIHTRRVL